MIRGAFGALHVYNGSSSSESCVSWSEVFPVCGLSGVLLHRLHEDCKRVICTAGDSCAFLVSKPLKPTFDFPMLSALH